MKNFFMVLVAGMLFSANLNAQAPEGFQFGAGIRVALPVGDFSESHTFGIGGEAQGEYGFSDKFSGILTVGYTNFFGKEVTILGTTAKFESVGLIPIIAGVRVYPAGKFFIGAQAGIGILTGDGSESAFCYQPQIGVNTEHFQIALNYNALSKEGSILGHVGLTGIFKLGGGGEAKK